jgi:hypothetical protein
MRAEQTQRKTSRTALICFDKLTHFFRTQLRERDHEAVRNGRGNRRDGRPDVLCTAAS